MQGTNLLTNETEIRNKSKSSRIEVCYTRIIHNFRSIKDYIYW